MPPVRLEIRRVDGEHERVVEDRAIEPIRHDEIDAIGIAVRIGALGPFVDPGEAVHAPLADLAQRGRDGRRLQSIQRRLQPVIVTRACAAAGEGQNFARRRRHQARGAQARVARFDDLASGPDQHVGVPDGRHAVLGHRLDADGDLAHAEIDRRRAVGLGEAEERIGHEVLRVPRREVAGESPEEFELLAFGAGCDGART